MSNHHLVEVENWRDFIAEAPDFEVTVYSGHEFRIPLEDILKQGAVDIDTFDSPLSGEKDPLYFDKDHIAKRGWQYYPLIVEKPLKGFIKTDEYVAGLVYKSNSGYEGPDCFNYVITNGLQQSNVGKVEVTVKPWYELKLSAIDLGEGRYSFEVELIIPDGEPVPDLEHYTWKYAGPHLEDGRVVYGEHPDYFWITSLRSRRTGYSLGFATYYYRYTGKFVRERSPNYVVPTHDSELEGYIDSTTGLPFVSKDELPEIIVKAQLWIGHYPGSREGELVELEAVLSEQFGSKWEKSGLVVDPEQATQDKLNGIESPGFAAPDSDNSLDEDGLVPNAT